ncbi:MAG: hypothetical protein JNL30_07515 [Rubrivivax sp.]|nr:hypothetical protein [Rubrivivax sp.]
MSAALPRPLLPPGAAPAALAALASQVQRNCDIADARHGAELTLCTYLLQMREFFRWERRLPLGAALPRAEVGAWMAEREARWQALEDEAFAPLRLDRLAGAAGGDGAEGDGEEGGKSEGGSEGEDGQEGSGETARRTAGGDFFDPFDAEAINAQLAPHGLVYGAGRVAGPQGARPVFFLASLVARGVREGLVVLQAGAEHARTLLAPPAALAGAGAGPVLLRRESMARWCWERTEAFALRPSPGSALHAMVAHYGLDRDFHAALPRWLDDHCETALLHELGEHRVGQSLGPRWADLRTALGDPRARALAGALRDQLADLDSTLPALLARGAPGPLHAWLAGYDGLRESLAPEIAEACARWRGAAGTVDAPKAVEWLQPIAARLRTVAQRWLAAWDEGGAAAAEQFGLGQWAALKTRPDA